MLFRSRSFVFVSKPSLAQGHPCSEMCGCNVWVPIVTTISSLLHPTLSMVQRSLTLSPALTLRRTLTSFPPATTQFRPLLEHGIKQTRIKIKNKIKAKKVLKHLNTSSTLRNELTVGIIVMHVIFWVLSYKPHFKH